jgi:hypothetical protein
MGLDNYWQGGDGELARTGKNYGLVGGLFSGFGDGSFRGEEYASLILDLTGFSLYDELSSDEVKGVAERLRSTVYSADWKEMYEMDDFEEDEWKDLVQMFCDYAELGARLVPWW